MTIRTSTFQNRLRAGLCLAAFTLWACNSSSTGTPDNGNGLLIDACTLVTKVEAEAIFGQSVLSTQLDTVKYITTCTYIANAVPGAVLPTRLTVQGFTTAGMQDSQGAGSTLTAQSYLAGLKTSLSAADWVAVTGVGAEAIWWTRAGRLTFYKGDVVSEIVYSPVGKGVDTSATAREGATTAAQRAAEKI